MLLPKIQLIHLRRIGEVMPIHPDTLCKFNQENIKAEFLLQQITQKEILKINLKIIGLTLIIRMITEKHLI